MQLSIKPAKTWMALVAAVSVCVLAINAADQPPGGQPGGGGGGGSRRGGGPTGASGGSSQRGGGSLLDDEQRKLYRESLPNDELKALDDKLNIAQKELMKATLAEKFDEPVVREKAEAVAKIQAEMTLLRAKALAKVAPTLKPEQKDTLENSRTGSMMLTSGFMLDFGGGGYGGRSGGGGFGGGSGGPGSFGGGRPGR